MGCSGSIYVRPHLYYDDIIYHKYGLELKLDLTRKLESMQYSAALAVTGAWRETNTTCFAKKLAGKSFTTESGTDACVTFTNCVIIRDRITKILKYHKNVSFGIGLQRS